MNKLIKRTLMSAAAVALAAGASLASAGASVSWTSPADGSAYPTGTSVSPTGQASGTGTVGGAGLDLILVLDSSGSMDRSETVGGETKTRREWQAQVAKALVNSLPTAATSVGIVEFDRYASTVQSLLGLTPAGNITTLENAIDSVDASGVTYIGRGIDEAKSELDANGTAGRSQMMVVFSDGSSSGDPGGAADTAIAGGVDAIHSVGLPGHSVANMQEIVDGADDSYGNADDHGVYTDANDLSTLLGIFSGIGGNLVGLDKVEVTLPDGTVIEVPTDALGNFNSPAWNLLAGANTFVAKAYATDGSTDTDTLTLYGRDGQVSVPEPASIALLGLGMAGLFGVRARKRA